eukprot:Nk52_evm1s2288 gene=Nk52_evmTU1s2288
MSFLGYKEDSQQSLFSFDTPNPSIVDEYYDPPDIVREREEKAKKEEEFYSTASHFRAYVYKIVDSNWFSTSILSVILLNTLVIGIQTDKQIEIASGWYFTMIDNIFLGIYCMETIMKVYVFQKHYFDSGWNTFDMIIVFTSIIDLLIPLIVQNLSSFDPKIFRLLRVFRAFKAIRALRVLRTISFLKNLQVIVNTIIQSIPALGSIVMLLFLVMYAFAIIARGIFADVDPGRYGNIFRTMFVLFQLITLDDWFFYYTDVKDKAGYIFVFLFFFIVLETFIFINLFVAVIVDNLGRAQEIMDEHKPVKVKRRKTMRNSLFLQSLKMSTSHSVSDDGTYPGERELDQTYESLFVPEQKKALFKRYFEVMASMESFFNLYDSKQVLLNQLVDEAWKGDEEEEGEEG